MGLTQLQRAAIEKARTLSGGTPVVRLSDEACSYLLSVIAADLGLVTEFPELNQPVAAFFAQGSWEELVLPGLDFEEVAGRLFQTKEDTDSYFACLANLHVRRLKYDKILRTQPLPTYDQVGPRGLLQFGQLSPRALFGLLTWRKWFFDIDNRAGQETGYLFEPIIASAIGGAPASARNSPVRRRSDENKGRQVDCLKGQRAYEIKMRVTIAASGQGRWREELDYPADCTASGLIPVLLVLDPTANPKLTELSAAFEAAGGETYVGADAWTHLDEAAGPTMAVFLETYVRAPLESLFAEADRDLPDFVAESGASYLRLTVGGESLEISRQGAPSGEGRDPTPDDVGDILPGP